MDLKTLLSDPVRADPYAFYAQLHSQGQASRQDPGRGGYSIAVHGFDAVHQVLRDQRFRQMDADYLDAHQPRWREHPVMDTLRKSVFFSDGPEHARLRGVIGSLFTPRRVAAMEPRIVQLIDELLERMIDDGPEVDFMASFAYALPSGVIGELLGVPAEDRDWFRPRVLAISAIFELDGSTWSNMRAADQAALEMSERFRELIAQRTAEPQDDLISGMIATGVFSTEALVANLITLYNAGFVTTTHMFGNGLTLLLERPELQEGLAQHALSYVDEILRYEPPAHFVVRHATAEVEVGGVQVVPGDTVLVMLGAANRDPKRFPDPDSFDPHRAENNSLTFGVGAHYCLGAALTRVEGSIGLPALFERFPHLALAHEPPVPRQLMFRGHDTLLVKI